MEFDEAKLDDIDALYASDDDKKGKKGKRKGKGGQKNNGIVNIEDNLTNEGATEKNKEKNKNISQKEDVSITDDIDSKLDSMYSDDDTKKSKKDKNKKPLVSGGDNVPATEPADGENEGPTVKTAAQKKKEKKEREKQKKLLEKTKQQEAGSTKESSPAPLDPPKNVAEDTEAQNEENTDKKKKKKPGAKKEVTKEDLKEKSKAKHVALLKERMEMMKNEQERLKREEEEAEVRREQMLKEQEEKERLEQERREKRKQKEKERKQRLKEEGKLLTEKQKLDRRRVQELLEARGIDIQADEGQEDKGKKKPRYEKLKRKNLPKQTSEEEVVTENDQKEVEEKTDKVETKVDDAEDDLADDWENEADKIEDNVEEVDEGKKASVRPTEEDEFDEDDEDVDDSEDESEVESESEESESEEEEKDPIEIAKERIRVRHEKCEAAKSEDNLRAGIVCVLGHVDTGKTKILDKLRRTNVQDGEAGGITQQIGATNVPAENIIQATKMCKAFVNKELKLPGLLIIDTPGHESFSNLRSRGSSLCDIAILVVDIMHGLEPQTIESIKLLLTKKTPFVVALNKIDRLYGWKTNPNMSVRDVIKDQKQETLHDFDDRLKNTIAHFAMQEINVKLFWENPDVTEYISMVPTSAHSGDGMGDLLSYLCLYAQDTLSKRLTYSEELQASVMEVKEIHGLGTTIDVILVNGSLHEGETIILAGQEGPIVTQIRGLLMPAPMKELRVKNSYDRCKELRAAQGVKIIAKDMEKALAGLPLYASSHPAEIQYYKEEVSRGLAKVLKGITVSDIGVYVQASTLGSLEALLIFLKSQKVPYSSINIGPIHKRDVMKASIMLEREPKWAVMLAFDVKVEREAQELADSLGVRIFTADIIYHLHDALLQYIEGINKANRDKFKDLAIFPVKVKILPNCIFNKRSPIVCGVSVEAGILREGCPLCVPSKENLEVGRVFSLELNNKPVTEAKKGQEVCIRIDPMGGDAPKMFGRHFDHTDMLVSKISRDSIDVMKEYFRDDLSKEDWRLMVELKKLLNVF